MLKIVVCFLLAKTAIASPTFKIFPDEIFAYRDSRISFTFENLDPKETYFLYFVDSNNQIQKKITTQAINSHSSKIDASVQIKKEGLVPIALVDSKGKIGFKANVKVQKSPNFVATLKQIAQKIFK